MDVSRRGLLALGTALTAASGVAAAPATGGRPFEGEALAWVRANARPFSGDVSIAELSPLVAALGKARVVGIGEATHGTHEDFAFKCQLIKAMVTFGGVRCVALEANFMSGLTLDGYVRKGVGEPVSAMRSSGFFQNWQSEEFGGLFTWLRGWNLAGKEPVRVIAIDCQASPTDAIYALDWLAKSGSPSAAGLMPRLMGLITPENRKSRLLEVMQGMTAAERDGYVAALIELKAAILATDKPGRDLAAHAAVTARQGLLAYERDVKDGPKDEPPIAYWAMRDRFMAENLIALAGQDRSVLHAHNGHVLPLSYDEAPDGTGSQGMYLRRALGSEYQTVCFEYDQGRVHAKLIKGDRMPGPDAPWIVSVRPSRPDGLGGFFARTGMDRFWLDVRAVPKTPAMTAWMAHPYQHDWLGFVATESTDIGPDANGSLEGAVDLIVFHRTVTPSRFYDFIQQA